ncbi:MAG: hypothetical protein ABSC77_00500 [Terracidiphilus sp.]|jgi:hypothetical protein
MRNLVFVLLLVLSLGICSAQTTSTKPVEPAAIGVIFRLDPSTQGFKPLPNEQWKAKGKAGWTTATGFLIVSGESSTFRIKAGESTEFVFILGNPESVSIYRFDQKKNERQFEMVKLRSNGRERENIPGIPTDLTKYGDTSYKLVPKSPLTPGEYAIEFGNKVFTFGID